jgi:ribosomal protein S15P/S13E
MSKQLTKEELTAIQKLNQDFVNAKVAIADAEVQKNVMIEALKNIKAEFTKNEKDLTKKYGQNATINLQTGAVTDPPPKDEEKVEEVKVEKVK